MKLKLDENLGHRWVDRLRDAGHDIDTVRDEGLSGASDIEVLAAAVEAQRALVSLDLDFANPLRFPPARTHGIAVLRVHERPGRHDLDQVVGRLIEGLRGRCDDVESCWLDHHVTGPNDGRWSGWIEARTALATFVVALSTAAGSGPWCSSW